MDTSAIMGFMNSLLDLIKREKPDNLAVAFDKGGSSDRKEIFEEYKANRNETPDAIKIAVPYIQEILKAMQIPILIESGYEADDIIGTVAKNAEKNNCDYTKWNMPVNNSSNRYIFIFIFAGHAIPDGMQNCRKQN